MYPRSVCILVCNCYHKIVNKKLTYINRFRDWNDVINRGFPIGTKFSSLRAKKEIDIGQYNYWISDILKAHKSREKVKCRHKKSKIHMKLLLPTFKSWYPFPNSQLTFCLLPTFFRGHLPTPNLVSWAPTMGDHCVFLHVLGDIL